jgi:hypothetical protein
MGCKFGGMSADDLHTLSRIATSYGVANTFDALSEICRVQSERVAASNNARPLTAIFSPTAEGNIAYWRTAMVYAGTAAKAVRAVDDLHETKWESK